VNDIVSFPRPHYRTGQSVGLNFKPSQPHAAPVVIRVALLFIAWDKYAIASGHWYFDKAQILGIFGPFGIPLEEYLFFIVVPIAALMTIEAVRTVKKHWQVYK